MTRQFGIAGFVTVFSLASSLASAAPAPATVPGADGAVAAPAGKVHYKAGKDVNFEEMLIQGQMKRPELSVVTGNEAQGADGLLRLRENFLDRMAEDFGESNQ